MSQVDTACDIDFDVIFSIFHTLYKDLAGVLRDNRVDNICGQHFQFIRLSTFPCQSGHVFSVTGWRFIIFFLKETGLHGNLVLTVVI